MEIKVCRLKDRNCIYNPEWNKVWIDFMLSKKKFKFVFLDEDKAWVGLLIDDMSKVPKNYHPVIRDNKKFLILSVCYFEKYFVVDKNMELE